LFTRHVLFSTLAVIACAVPASATISYYSDSGTFSTAATGLTAQPVSFDSNLGFSGVSLALDGLTFTGFDGVPNPANVTVVGNVGSGWPSGDTLERSGTGGGITITFGTGVRAFFLTFSSTSGFNNTAQLAVVTSADNSSSQVSGVFQNGPNFEGVATDHDITSATISFPFTNSAQLELGGLSFFTPTTGGGGPGDGGGDPGSAPEPATFFLIGTGLAAVPLLRRLRRS
jgi:hypothetical protein